MKKITKTIILLLLACLLTFSLACCASSSESKEPTIGENGHWFIGSTDTGINATGDDGVSPTIGSNGNWFIGSTDTGVVAKAVDGKDGSNGQDGEDGKDFWKENPQGLKFYPLTDETFAVGAGNACLLSEITIPKTYLGKNVTAVIDNGFEGLKNLTKITLPETVKTIGDKAFYNSKKFSSLTIGENQVQLYTFMDCSTQISGVTVGKSAFEGTDCSGITIEDSSDNDTVVNVLLNNIPATATKLKISASLNYITDNVAVTEIDLNGTSSDYEKTADFKAYGLFENVDVELYAGDNVIASFENKSGVKISADKYTFAYLNGSYPVLVYTLKLKDITENGTIPSYVLIDRDNSYDWNNLMYNVKPMPMLTKQEATAGGFHNNREATAEYIKQLYEINNESTFTLYAVDNYSELILQMMVANRIPEEQWNAVLLSDGTGTAGLLSQTFSVSNPEAKYNEMVKNWNEVKRLVYNNGFDLETVSSAVKYQNNQDEYQLLETYPYIIINEQANVTWWVNRLRVNENLATVNAKSASFAKGIVDSVVSYNTNALLASLSSEDKESFKQMYKFSGDMFSVAEEANKKVMIILGTSWSGEQASFYNYIRMTMDFYGDEYVYYYKGHPGYPTSTFPERQTQLTQLETDGYTIYELDNAIAAEIILFFKPNVYLSGWSSSTFESVENQSMACALYNCTYANKPLNYGHLIDCFMSKIADASSTYSNIALNSEHSYYLIEYNNGSAYENQINEYNKHEIAIFDATSKIIKYYKLISSNYVEVNVDGTAIS